MTSGLYRWPPLPDAAQPAQYVLPSDRQRDINNVQASHLAAAGQRSAQVNDKADMGNPARTVLLPPSDQPPLQHVAAGGCSCQDWSAVSTTPGPSANRFAPLSFVTDDDDEFIPVRTGSRRRPRQRQRLSTGGSNYDVAIDGGASASQSAQTARRRRSLAVYGKSTDGSTISAAQMIRKKAVFCVDNVGLDGSVDKMKAFITSKLGVKVLTCFEVNPRRRRDEDDMTDRKAFRVCIYHDDRQRFRNDRVGPESIVVSDWFFKNKTAVDNNDRHKRRRIGSDSNKNGISRTHPDVPPPVNDISIDVRNSEVDIDVDVVADVDEQAVDDTIVVSYIPNDGE